MNKINIDITNDKRNQRINPVKLANQTIY